MGSDNGVSDNLKGAVLSPAFECLELVSLRVHDPPHVVERFCSQTHPSATTITTHKSKQLTKLVTYTDNAHFNL